MTIDEALESSDKEEPLVEVTHYKVEDDSNNSEVNFSDDDSHYSYQSWDSNRRPDDGCEEVEASRHSDGEESFQ